MLAINRVLLASAASLVAASAAQAQTIGSPTATGSYQGQDSLDRAAVYTQSAFTAPKGHYGITVQAGRATDKATVGNTETEFNTTAASFSAFYGITDGITLGAGLPYLSFGAPGAESVSGMGDAQVFGRMSAYRSGATRVAVGAGATLPTGEEGFGSEDPSYQVDAAVTHRMNRISFHVSPALRLEKDTDMSYNLNIAGTYAATSKLAASVELLNAFDGGPSGADADRTRWTDVGASVRYNAAQNLMLDLGIRMNVSTSIEGADISSNLINAGFAWMF